MRASVLTERLREFVQREFPDVSLPQSAMFLPMYSLDFGELSSTAAVEIAKVLKLRAEIVAERVIEYVSRDVKADWRHDNGYIVCADVPTDILLSEVRESVSSAIEAMTEQPHHGRPSPCRVWCLIPDSTAPAYARMRVIARAALQGLLAVVYQGQANVCLFPCPEREVRSVADVALLFRQAIEWVIDNDSEVRRSVSLPDLPDRVSVWTTHHYHEKLDASFRESLMRMRRSNAAVVTMPDDGWLLSRDRALSEILEPRALRRVIQQLHRSDEWLRLLLHLASTTPSGDFDPAVALFEESASPLWNMRTLLERYGRFGSLLPMPVSVGDLPQLIQQVTAYRKLVLSGLFLPLYTARAILHNDVGAWCGAFERLAREGHAFINAPETRLSLAQNAESASCREIAAGLGFGLSCILPLVTEA